MLDIAKWFLVVSTVSAILFLAWDIVSKRRRARILETPRFRSMYFSIVGKSVQPGGTITISSPMSYNTTFYPMRLLISGDCARHFSILDLKVANMSQLAGSPIPAEVFVPPTPKAVSYFDTDSYISDGPVNDTTTFRMDPINPGDDITLIVKNTASEVIDFSAAILGKVQVRSR